jgi:HlyD family secretion protein
MNKPSRILISIPFLIVSCLIVSCRDKSENSGVIEVSGLIEAIKTEVRAQAQGEVKEIHVKEGQKVKKGDSLCVLDEEKLKIQLSQVEAGIEGARSKLKLAIKGTKQELIKIAKNQLAIAAKELDQAKLDQERMAKLLEEGAISQNQKERADLRLTPAQEQYKSADENYRMALRGREKEEIEIAEADLKNLESQERLLRRYIQDTRIVSPINGFLEEKHIEIGELASPGTILFSIIDFGQTYVKAYVPEKYVGRIKISDAVEVKTDAFAQKTYTGKINYISEEAEFAPKNVQTKEERLKLVYMIKSYLDNSSGELKPGMPVDVKIVAR